MNEIELKLKIEGLEKAIQEHKADASRYEDQLKETNKQLEDYNKPEITPIMLDNIYEAVEKAMEEFDFNDLDNFAMDYAIDYDGKVYCENLELCNHQDLVEMIVEKVSRIFTEAECPEDTPEKVKYDE